MSIRISIVEDDEPTRRILADLIRGAPDFELVSDYGDTAVALESLPREKPDVVLMDINLIGSSGVECVRHLKPLLPATQFLMLTVYEDSDHIFAALAAGATGYLLKDTTREELFEAIQQITLGGSPMSSSIARRVVLSFTQGQNSPSGVERLSPREQSVLSLLTKGYLYKEIAEQLAISVPTVSTYIRRIYEKLQVRSRSQAIVKYLKHPV